jgi:hypothetical protein
MTELFAVVGGATVGGVTITTIAYQMFKHLGSKWLDEKFETRLQKLKHDQEKEMANMQFEISKMFDRATKLHQAEFEVLPKVWDKLNDSYWTTRRVTASFQSYPDIANKTPPQIVELLNGMKWPEHEKHELLQAPNSEVLAKEFQKLWDFHNHNEAERATREAHTFILKQGLFIEPVLREKIKVINDLIWNAVLESGINLSPAMQSAPCRDHLRNHIQRLESEGDAMMEDLLKAIEARVWSEPAGEG